MAAAIGIAKTATEIFLGVGEVSIDNLTFQLHYRWSVTLFIVCSVLVQTSQFFGDPVQCETVSICQHYSTDRNCALGPSFFNKITSIHVQE